MIISTIIPVYNAEQYIKRCIDSLINAQIPEITNEIILVDDGSTDNSLGICKEYENRFPNIKVFSQKNQGPSVARNLGLDQAKGDWITFVDSDDWVMEQYFESFLKESLSNSQLILFGYNKVSKNGIIKNKRNKEILKTKEILNQTLTYNSVLWFPWNKFYRSEIINNHRIKFNPKIKIGEDTIFNISYLKNINEIHLISDILYNYIEVETSLTQVKYKENLLLNMENHFLERQKLQPENKMDLANYYIDHILFWLLNNTRYSLKDRLNEIIEIRKSIIYKDLFQFYQFNWKKPRQALIVKLFQLRQYKLLMKLMYINA